MLKHGMEFAFWRVAELQDDKSQLGRRLIDLLWSHAIGGGALPRLVRSSPLDLLMLHLNGCDGRENGARARRGEWAQYIKLLELSEL